MKFTATALVIGLLTGCATHSEIYLADGRKGYTAGCSGSQRTWATCYRTAGEVCKQRGFDVINQHEGQGSTVSATQFGAFGSTTNARTLVFACK